MRSNGSGNERDEAPAGRANGEVISPGEAARRLRRVRTALESGEYSVDLDRLADRILDDELARGVG